MSRVDAFILWCIISLGAAWIWFLIKDYLDFERKK